MLIVVEDVAAVEFLLARICLCSPAKKKKDMYVLQAKACWNYLCPDVSKKDIQAPN